MFVSSLKSDSSYFMTNTHFASVKYDGERVTYKFDLYGRLLQALIDGHDIVKIQIVRRLSPEIKYFVGTSKEDIEISNIGFVQNTKRELQKTIVNATIAETDLELVNLLSDDLVSGVGSNVITTKNYIDFLPVIEQEEIKALKYGKIPVIEADTLNFKHSTLNLFRTTGIYPGKVADISFPSQKLTNDSAGLMTSGNPPSQRALLRRPEFFDYYNKYLKRTNTKIRQNFRKGKAEFQKLSVEIPLELSEYDLATLTNYENLALRVVLIDNNIEMSSKLFRFKNAILFEEATAGVKNLEAAIIVPKPQDVLPDAIRITNREIYPVQITVNEFYLKNKNIEKKRVAIKNLEAMETVNLQGSQIYFDNSQSRCYAVSANKHIPGIKGVSNVLNILAPPEVNTPPKSNEAFDIQIKPGTISGTAEILISGIQSQDESAIIYRKKIGTGEREMIARAGFKRKSVVDKDIQQGDVYVYTAELQMNSAGCFAKSTTGYVALLEGNVARISFSLTEKISRGTKSNPQHGFKILENIATTASSQLLDAANAAGQSGVFADEIEESKEDTTIISSYMVVRTQRGSSIIEQLGTFEANKKLVFGFSSGTDYDFSTSAIYEYVVLPKAVGVGSLSYTTTVEETDINTGNSYKYSYKKWRDSNFERAMTLPSNSEVLSNNIQDNFNNLPYSSGETIEFSSQFKPGSITAINATSKDNLDCTFISWKYTGDVFNVLHFVVLANYNGHKAPIGIAIPDQVNGKDILVSYCDEKLGSVSGQVIYSILPVYRDGSSGGESRNKTVKSSRNYPKRALRN